MNKTKEALKMAIETLHLLNEHVYRTGNATDAIKACKEALESQKQEPVAWVYLDMWLSGKHWPDDCFSASKGSEALTPLYTHPAQPLTRDWIGTALERADKDEAFRKGLIGELAQPLSDDEIMILLNEIKYSAAEVETTFDYEIRIARAIEAYHGIGVKDE